jgi:hypothetical protein
MLGLPPLISSLRIHHPEPNMNEKIYFTMLTLLLSFANVNSLEFVSKSRLIIPSLKFVF